MLDRSTDWMHRDTQDRSTDNLDCAIIALAVQAHDLAERDLDDPGNRRQLRTTMLALLRRLDRREQLGAAETTAR